MKRSISNIKQKCCWSCKYYAGERDYKNGFFFGSSFDVDERGQCTKNKGNNRDGSTIYSWYCSHYERAGDVAAYIKQEEAEREAKRQQREAESLNLEKQRKERQLREESRRQERELEVERTRIANERLALERERKKLEYERWYSSLSDEEKVLEDKRVEEQRKKEEEERKERERQYAIYQEQERQRRERETIKARKRKKVIIFSTVGILVAIGAAIVGVFIGNGIAAKNKQDAFNNSATGVFKDYLSQLDGYQLGLLDGVGVVGKYGGYVDIDSRGRIYLSIEYCANGFKDSYGRTCDFRAITYLLPKAENAYTEIDGYLFFNLEGSDNEASFRTSDNIKSVAYPDYCALAQYGAGTVLTQYSQVNYSEDIGGPTYNMTSHSYDNWDKTFGQYKEEWISEGWTACFTSYLFVDQLFSEATGSNLY